MREKKMLRRTAAGMIAAVLMAGGISTVYAAETPGLSLGNDGAVAAEISLLQPDSTYYFPVQYTREDGRLVQVRASEADALELEVRSGEALDGAEIRTWNGRCYVRLETAGDIRDGERYTTELTLRYDRGGDEETLDFAVTAGLRAASLSSVQGRGTHSGQNLYAPLHRSPADGTGPAEPLASGDLCGRGLELYRYPHCQGDSGFLGDPGEHSGSGTVSGRQHRQPIWLPGRRQL